MKYRLGLIMILTVLALSGCYRPIKGQVMDAETKQPIEGAVVLVEWTKTRGFGHTGTLSYKVVEVVSDKEGKVKIPGCYSPFVDPPDVTVYKKGYVAWNNHSIFPGTPRIDFKWGDFIFELKQFDPRYSHEEHVGFIRACIHVTLNDQSKRTMYNAYEWEQDLVIQERRKSR